MEALRQCCLSDPSFACSPQGLPGRPGGLQYQPQEAAKAGHDAQGRGREPDNDRGTAPPQKAPCPLRPFLRPNPANFAALRCDWTHPAVLALVLAQAVPGVSLLGAGRPAGDAGLPAPQPRSLWNSMLPALTAFHHPVCSCEQLQSLGAAPGGGSAPPPPAGTALAQPSICVGHQDDWLELSPAMLPLWPTVAFEPFAGKKPVQYFVLCPEELQSQALLFVKDVAAQYELCNLGPHHAVLHQPWLFTFSTSQPPEAAAWSQAGGAWERLSPLQRYLVGLRSAAERLQRALLTSPLQLRQEGPALELNLGSSPVVYIVCPFAEGSGQLEAALAEAACCLAPCTPAGAWSSLDDSSGESSGSKRGSCLDGFAVGGPLAATGQGQQRVDLWGPATPDPGGDRQPGAAPDGSAAQSPAEPMAVDGDGGGGSAAAAGAAAAGDEQQAEQRPPSERYHGAADGLFQQQAGDCQRAAQREFPRASRAPPADITLQVVGPACFGDLSGQAAKAVAFELYTKIRRRPRDPCAPQPPAQQQQQHQALPDRPLSPADPADTAAAPLVPFCSEPLITLALGSLPAGPLSPASQQALSPHAFSPRGHTPLPSPLARSGGSMDVSDLVRSPSAGTPRSGGTQRARTLHCCYALPPDLRAVTALRPGPGFWDAPPECVSPRGAPGPDEHAVLLVPAAWTDSCGELLHCDVVEVDLQGPSSLERRASLGGPLQRTASLNLERTPYGLVCTALVQRSVELLGHLRASAHPPNGLQHVVIARLGEFHPTERSAWEQILADRPLLLPDVSSSHRMAVVGLQAALPARLATPSNPPGGGRVLFQPGGAGGQPSAATLAVLPSDDPGALVLPGEHDTLRTLQLAFVGGGGGGRAAEAHKVAAELYGLAVLSAAHFLLLCGSCTAPTGLRAPAAGGGAPPSAHLPLHAYLVERMLALLRALCDGCGTGLEGG